MRKCSHVEQSRKFRFIHQHKFQALPNHWERKHCAGRGVALGSMVIPGQGIGENFYASGVGWISDQVSGGGNSSLSSEAISSAIALANSSTASLRKAGGDIFNTTLRTIE